MAQSKSASKTECHPLALECIEKYKEILAQSQNQAYSFVHALCLAVDSSKENTWHSFNEELECCSQQLLLSVQSQLTEDRTILSMKALSHIFSRITQKVDFEKSIQEIKQSIKNKGLEFAAHCSNTNILINRFAEPHLREGMVSLTKF